MTKLKSTAIAESHRRQFYGEDYQAVAIDLADAGSIGYDSNDYTALQSAPDPECRCAFCASAPWEDS